jgi:putative peptidoglycan lipid II flippase
VTTGDPRVIPQGADVREAGSTAGVAWGEPRLIRSAVDTPELDDIDTRGSTAAAAGDSIAVAVWTVVSRVTGVARFAAIGAVLGPTFFGNTYQFTNSLPNQIYYGFLGGSLLSSLLVPVLVRHLDTGDGAACRRIAGGFLGVSLLGLVAVLPVAVLVGPLVLGMAAHAGGAVVGDTQVQVGRWLILMFAPQVFCYGVVAAATAVMNARRRFALAAAAPALENIGILVVLALNALLFGAGTDLDRVRSTQLLLLGLGTTGAVALHAATQWWGARRAGITLVPRAGWRDSEVRVIVRRALPSLAQAGLVALQVLTLLVLANRVPGGVVAFQLALSFYYLAIALGATPVALSLLPRLARMHHRGETRLFRDTVARGLAQAFFLTVPAAVGYLVLAEPLARAVAFGQMNSVQGVTMVAASMAALTVASLGQTAFLIATYVSYARQDTRSPLLSMLVQAATCLILLGLTLPASGTSVLVAIGLAFSASVVAAAGHLLTRVLRGLERGTARLAPSLGRIVAGAVAMAGPAWLVAMMVSRWAGAPLGLAAGIGAGAAVYLALQALWRSPELAALTGGLRLMRARAGRTHAQGSCDA